MIELIRNLKPLIRREIKDAMPWFTWATITSTNPLRIRIDGEGEPMPTTPSATVTGLRPGDRVDVRIANGRASITGINGGSSVRILTTENLNTVLTYGDYMQTQDVNSTTARNYPIIRAGLLEVHHGISKNGLGFTFQRYTAYQTSGEVSGSMPMFTRRYDIFQGSWSAWTRVDTPKSLPDLPWTALTLASGYSVYNNRTPQYCRKNDIYYFKGAISANSGAFLDSLTMIASGIPPHSEWANVSLVSLRAGAGYFPVAAQISAAGNLQIRPTNSGTRPSWVGLAGLSGACPE